MSILAALNKSYETLAAQGKVPLYGYSNEKIGYVISLLPDGSLAGPPIDIRKLSGKKPAPQQMQIPQPPKKTVGIRPNFLSGNCAYVLGVSVEKPERAAEAHKAFVDYHLLAMQSIQDEGLEALTHFLTNWDPTSFEEQNWPEEIKTGLQSENIVFTLESDRQNNIHLHDRPAAHQLWAKMCNEGEKSEACCLVTGLRAPIARLHPSIKNVWGAQSSGASIISFNKDAFESYGHEQGDNAPVSEAAAFGYTTILNKYLEKGSRNRIQIGDASTVFWAQAPAQETAQNAEDIFSSLFSIDEEVEAETYIKPILEKIRNGQPLGSFKPELSEGVSFYILGLAPNAARISVRFWMENSFQHFIANYQRFMGDMRLEPAEHDKAIPLWKYLLETATLNKRENVPPTLSGEWFRSILTGTNYPYTLLSTVLMRIRADRDVNVRRVAILKSLLVRNFKREVPVAFDPDNTNKGYLLGRLFALYEKIQHDAAGGALNASVKDKFYGSASAQPRKVFPLLDRNSANHLSKLGKQKPGWKVNLERQLGDLMNRLSPEDDPFPSALSADQQALFAVGYYHQRNEFFKSSSQESPVKEKETV